MKALSVNYNTPDLLDRMLEGFRKFYDIPMLLIDGSDEKHYPKVEKVFKQYENIEVHHFDYNIHHGGGMAYGFSQIDDEKIIVIDTDIVFYRAGAIERMNDELRDESYGIGDIQIIDKRGFNARTGIKYLHPAFMLVNKSVYIQYPPPIIHGAPMIRAMEAIHESGNDILQSADYITHDFRRPKKKLYLTRLARNS